MKKFILFALMFMLILTACSKKEDAVETGAELPAEEEEGPDLTGLAKNPLTGIYIDEEVAARRSIAVVINNLHKALPQSGIGQADLYYETLAEGEITRIVAIFQELDAEKIGPVRSARDYFTYYALDNDALFVHHGGSESAYAAISNRDIDDLDGMTENGTFWRDAARANTPGMYEHSSYTNAENILNAADAHGYRMESENTPVFEFYEENTVFEGTGSATEVTVPFSYYQTGEFMYNEETGLYLRSQSGEEQIDELTGEQLEVKNIILQFADMYVIEGDADGHREVKLTGTGTGKLISNGRMTDIMWMKENASTPTKWYMSDGSRLLLNPGKTWICVFDASESENISYGPDIPFEEEKVIAKGKAGVSEE